MQMLHTQIGLLPFKFTVSEVEIDIMIKCRPILPCAQLHLLLMSVVLKGLMRKRKLVHHLGQKSVVNLLRVLNHFLGIF